MIPQVSIIVPIYNVEQYLEECLDSLVNQTLKDIEIICVNDASPDGSLLIAEKYAANDARIKVVSHQKNQGLGPARNTGVEHAVAPYVMFVDSDDVVTHNMAERLYTEMQNQDVDLVWCNIGGMSESGDVKKAGEAIPAGLYTSTQVLSESYLYQTLLPVWNKLYKRALIEDVKQQPIVSEDQPFLAVVLGRCKKIVVIQDSLYYYRNRQGTLSKPKLHTANSWNAFFYAHKLFFQLLPNTIEYSAIKMQSMKRYFSLFWRIRTFNLVMQETWEEQRECIYNHIKNNEIPVKHYNVLLYCYLWFVFHKSRSISSTKSLVHLGFDWSAYMCRHASTSKVLIFLIRRIVRVIQQQVLSLIDNLEQRVIRLCSIFIKKDIWLIGERMNTYQDNGMYFFKYLQNTHPEIESYYVISKDYSGLVDSENVLRYNSFKHKVYFCAARVYANSHYDAAYPRTRLLNKRYYLAGKTQNVFLQHGITCSNVSQFYGKRSSDIDMFICAVLREKTVAIRDFGYTEQEAPLTGFARYDGLNDYVVKNQILLMPTWRRGLQSLSETEFKTTSYFTALRALLTSGWLKDFLQEHQLCLKFAPHYEMTPYLHLFDDLQTENIEIVDTTEVSVQTLLKESKILITDVSSVQFDFAYMQKPIVYYQWDYEEIIKTHLGRGYFNFEIDGFGPVCGTEEEVRRFMEALPLEDWKMPATYVQRVNQFFQYRDNKNCERIYNAIKVR